jgi:hypothetical protein
MAFDIREFRFWRLAGPAGAAVVLTSGLLGTGPAVAADNIFGNVLGFVGLQNNNKVADDAIDYKPRPPLVVPPSRDLPPPEKKSARSPDWPTDPDAIARRRAEADSRRPAPRIAPEPPTDTKPVVVRMSDCPNNVCDDDSFWDKLRATFSYNKQSAVLTPGEPSREYLVEPPLGYRRPVPLSQAPQQQSAAMKPGVQQVASPRDKNKLPTVAPEVQAEAQAAQTQAAQPQAAQPKDHFGLW